ncbi:MAG: Tripartite-type tricarboxylate transporter, receptor component TctC [Hyphomicrobiales bacterium]|nr:Tripartite-type tricarboxylate transporter, receptor component TctC [Hyphomicrobiales bacterium]
MNKISRRTFNTGLTAALGADLVGTSGARAQSFATRDVLFICGFAAGSGADLTVRFFAEKMRPMLGRNVLVENKVGALSNIATEYVARSKPDGHTLYVTSAGVLAANQHLLKTPTVDLANALQVFGTINKAPYMITVRGDSPYKSIAELTAAMKEKGDKASYGFAAGGAVKVVGALYKEKAGLQAVEISYRASADYVNDLASGKIDFVIADNVFAIAQQQQGRMRILAVSTPQRLQAAPDYPTMTELGYPVNVIGWWAGLVPSATPRPIVDQLGKMLNDVVASEDGKKFLSSIGSDPWIQTPDQGQAFMREQIKDWGEYVKIANIEKQG